jgi:plasmid stability protein
MPTLIVENVPPEVYERLQRRAAVGQRTLPQEMLHLLQKALDGEDSPSPRLPEFIVSEEISAPFDLPRSSQPMQVVAYDGPLRLPDPLPESEPG